MAFSSFWRAAASLFTFLMRAFSLAACSLANFSGSTSKEGLAATLGVTLGGALGAALGVTLVDCVPDPECSERMDEREDEVDSFSADPFN
jgi:hypothetical protein